MSEEGIVFVPIDPALDTARRLAFLDAVLQRVAAGESVGPLPFDPLQMPLPLIEFLIALHSTPAATAAPEKDGFQ